MGFSKKLPGLAPFCGQMPRVKYYNQDIDEQLELDKLIFLHKKRQAIEESMMTVLFMDTAAIKERRTWMCKLEEIGHRLEQKPDPSISGLGQPKYLLSSLDDMPKYFETSSPYRTMKLPAKKTESMVYPPVKTGKTKLQEKPEMKDKQKIGTASRKPAIEEKHNIETASMADSVRIASKAEMVPSPRKAAERDLVAGLEGKTSTVESESRQLKGGSKMSASETEFAGAERFLLLRKTEILPDYETAIETPSSSRLRAHELDTVSTAFEITSVSGPNEEAQQLASLPATAASELTKAPHSRRNLYAHETKTDDGAPKTIEKPETSDQTKSRPLLEYIPSRIICVSSPSTVGANIASAAVEQVEGYSLRKSLCALGLENIDIDPETTEKLEKSDQMKLGASSEPTSPAIVSISAASQSESMEGKMATVAMRSVEAGLLGRGISARESSTFNIASKTMEETEADDHMRSGPSLMHTLPPIASSSHPSIEIESVDDNMSKVSAEIVEHGDDIQPRLETKSIHALRLAPGRISVPKTAETTVGGDRMRIGPSAESSLSFEEAWHLFCQQVGEVINNPDVHPYAWGIVEQCSGSKLLIILTGRALAEEKDITVWEFTFKHFLSPIKAGKSGVESITPKLKFIYSRLKTRGTKKLSTRMCDLQGCFLYCALFPQDYQVNTSTLVQCWIHEGLIAGNAEDGCKIGHEIVKILVETALLESVEDGHCVKMHRMIRDFALELVLQEVEARRLLATTNFSLIQLPSLGISPLSGPLDQNVLKAGAGIMEPPLEEQWEKAKMIFLMDNELSSLPERLKCRNLLALFLQRNQCLREIPISFFDCMPSLQVLNLSETGITSLPKSVLKLKSLKELVIRDCEHLVKLPSEVGELQRLELLDLCGTEIDKLPIKTGQLASLKYMKISFYGSVDPMEYSKLPPKLLSKTIISRLLSLKILGINVTPGDPRWNKIAKRVTSDISKLSNITDLHFYFPQKELVDIFVKTSPSWRGNNLKNFNFVVGHDVKRMISRVPHSIKHEYSQRGQCLRFVNGETIPEAVIKVLSRTTSFYLDHHLNIHSLSEFGVRNIMGLEICVVRECPEMERIVDGEELTLPFLECLSIHYLENFKCIWRSNLAVGSFACLKYLHVRKCRQLNFVLTSSMSEHLANLEELVVDDCQAMTAVIQVDQDKIVEPGHSLLPRLKSLTLHYLPQLVCVWKGSWPSLECISFYHCPNLRNLDMESDTKLKRSIKQIKAEKDWWCRLEWKQPSLSLELQAYFTSLDHELT